MYTIKNFIFTFEIALLVVKSNAKSSSSSGLMPPVTGLLVDCSSSAPTTFPVPVNWTSPFLKRTL